MATSKAQQVGIWIIAVVLTVGTIASFVAIVLGNDNQRNEQARLEQQQEEAMKEFERQAAERLASLEAIEGYTVTPFDAASVTELRSEVLTEGTGTEVKTSDTIKASYTGWLSDGKIFDSTKVKNTDDAPVSFGLNQVIKGWTDGLAGKKVGSVVRLTIPSEQGYGAAGSPPTIPANAPLQFIVKIQSIEPAAQ